MSFVQSKGIYSLTPLCPRLLLGVDSLLSNTEDVGTRVPCQQSGAQFS